MRSLVSPIRLRLQHTVDLGLIVHLRKGLWDVRIWEQVLQDEAFDLWTEEWGSLYEAESQSRDLLRKVRDTWFLVSVVENDYIKGDLFSAFRQAPTTNGTSAPATNGKASSLEKGMPAHVGGADTEDRAVKTLH